MSKKRSDIEYLTFGEHLDIMRKMILRIAALVLIVSIILFYFKTEVFEILLAPRNRDFFTFEIIERWMNGLGLEFHFKDSATSLISTELSAQFMTHITVSCALGLLLTSPYILIELFRFILPALYEHEIKNFFILTTTIYTLFVLGMIMSYYILFPISYHFLVNYQVEDSIKNFITLDSYISTFTTLTFLMGVVFQLPVIVFVLGRFELLDSKILKKYRPYAFVLIMVIAAIITPPDIFTLLVSTLPIYGLYELSILILCRIESKKKYELD